MKKIFFLSLLILMTYSCQNSLKKSENIFKDSILQRIYTLQDERNTAGLIPYFTSENSKYRRAAALAFGSVQDSLAIEPLSTLLNDENARVRAAAAYALGQIKNNKAEPIIMERCVSEQNPEVKMWLLEALGKCGTKSGLNFLVEMNFPETEKHLLIGQAWGMYRFALQGITSNQGTAKSIAFIGQNYPERVRFIAGNYLARAREIDLLPYYRQLMSAFKQEKSVFIRMNLAQAMGKVKHAEILAVLKSMLTSGDDYRVKVNAIAAITQFEYDQIRESLFELLSNPNINVAIKAAEYFPIHGISKDADSYFDMAKQLPNWRTRTNMLAAALKFAEDKKDIAAYVVSAFNKTDNKYEKANLLKALSGDVTRYRFVASQVFSENDPVLKTYGMEALVAMRQSDDFNALCKSHPNVFLDFNSYFKKAILSGDVALIGITAGILRDPKMNFKSVFKKIDFLTTALSNCVLPKDVEAYLELQKTIHFFKGIDARVTTPSMMNNPIDWKLVTSISPDQRVIFKTTKGDITVQLFVNDAPGSVAYFVKLIKDGFYNKSVVHRVVPNFVIQDGCPRGDGWGAPDYSIRSEFAPLYYGEGSVGMASAGKDTEASQWFITHSPTPHLDGRYSIFGKVISGMEHVHEIEVGDKILGIDII